MRLAKPGRGDLGCGGRHLACAKGQRKGQAHVGVIEIMPRDLPYPAHPVEQGVDVHVEPMGGGLHVPIKVKVLTKDKVELEAHQRVAFRWLVLATAWQESCWRQYEMRDGRVVPLRSRTGDVGMMQVNEKVWRGFYDLDSLRHDTAYNVRAGAEILAHYQTRYALRSRDADPDDVNALARITYSLYNGGPGRARNLDRLLDTTKLKRVDQLFWGRFRRVRAGDELGVAACF